MAMYNDWRLVDDIEAYVSKSQGQVVFVPIGKKTTVANYLKKIGDQFNLISLDSPTFEVTLTEDLRVFCKHKRLGDEPMEVVNFAEPLLGRLLVQAGLQGGGLVGSGFEICVSDKLGAVSFVKDGMKDYDTYFDETVRRLNCSIKKKTTKWIPGHRYDSETETFYYLGEFRTRKADPLASELLSRDNTVPCYLVVGNARGLKTVSSVFNERVFGEEPGDIKVLTKLPKMVDSGKALEDDKPNIHDYWEAMVKNSLSRYVTYKGSLPECPGVRYVFDVFAYYSNPGGKWDHEVSIPMKQFLTDLLERLLLKSYLEYYDISNYGMDEEAYISSSKDRNENMMALANRTISSFGDPNVFSRLYYSQLFQNMGINFQGMAYKVVGMGEPKKIVTESWMTYREMGHAYFKYHERNESRKQCFLRDKSYIASQYSRYDKPEKVTIKKTYGSGPLCKELIKIIEEEKSSAGIGVSSYSVVNMGTKKDPNEYIKMTIDIEDIEKRHPKMPQDLMDDIVSNRFQQMLIEFDKGITIE